VLTPSIVVQLPVAHSVLFLQGREQKPVDKQSEFSATLVHISLYKGG
jgi:hypothetical protein